MTLFFFNNDGECERSSSAITSVTTAGRFDSAFVDSAIRIPSASLSTTSLGVFLQSPRFPEASPSVTTFNLHHEMYHTATTSVDRRMYSFQNSAGVTVFRIQIAVGSSTTAQCEYWNGSAFVAIGSTFTYAVAVLQTIDIRLTAGASGTVRVYLGGVEVVNATGMNAAVTNFANVRIHNPGSSGDMWVSQIVGATYDVRDANVLSRRPTGNGARADGTGVFGDVNTIPRNDATAINLPTVGAKRTFTKAAITVPSGKVVKAVAVNGLVRASSPAAGAKAILTIAGTDYQAAGSMGATTSTEARGQIWENHPVTGIPFTGAQLDAIQAFGYEAV